MNTYKALSAEIRGTSTNLNTGVRTEWTFPSSASITTGSVSYDPYAPRGYPSLLGKSGLTTDMYARRETTDVPWSMYYMTEHRSRSYYGSGTRFLFTPGLSYPALSSDQRSFAEELLRKAIYQAQSGSQSGVLLGELRETLRLLRNPIASINTLTKKLVQTYGRLRQRVNRSVLRNETAGILRDASSAWLTYQFGMRPLVSDVNNHIDHVNRLLDRIEKYTVARSKDQTDHTYTHKPDTKITGTGLGVIGTLTTHDTLELSVRGIAQCRETLSSLRGGIESFGFRTDDFIPTIYELIPWSWVVDYFTNLGDLVQAAFADLESVTYSSVTTHLTWTRRFLWHMDGHINPDATGVVNIIPGHSIRKTINRFPLEELPTKLRLELPSGNQVMNLAALLGTFINSRL